MTVRLHVRRPNVDCETHAWDVCKQLALGRLFPQYTEEKRVSYRWRWKATVLHPKWHLDSY